MSGAGKGVLTVAVVGAGLMGHGIAQVFAVHGHSVRITDAAAGVLATVRDRIAVNLIDLGENPAAVERVLPCALLADAVEGADYVVEAAAENLDAKQALFASIEAAAPSHAILASNTSVIPITSIMSGLRDRSRCLGTHWWNPPHLVPLVEVIGTEWTRPEVVAWTLDLHRALGKTVIHVKRDIPGFIGNRLQAALWREAIALVEHGICDAADVDVVVKASFGRRLAVLGPLENADLIGTDLTLAIHQTIMPAIDARSDPSPYLSRIVAEGRLGMKAGQGFKNWTPDEADSVRQALTQHLKAARERDDPGDPGTGQTDRSG
ncbi:3-hydroxyacyl-CoA dehydrogenase family protein [Lichenicoccus sp.]|uniref:3-hydroxyacyl-CoA dehydrogenase family protein n=1 Tax=Lichenicoccus sp. TaxID=2781899 RepID=UPI003D11288C